MRSNEVSSLFGNQFLAMIGAISSPSIISSNDGEDKLIDKSEEALLNKITKTTTTTTTIDKWK
jgi:hypothetical protein